LEELNCPYNQLTSIDISKNTKLKKFNFSNNSKLKEINLENNVNLEELYFSDNVLVDLKIPHKNQLKRVKISEDEFDFETPLAGSLQNYLLKNDFYSIKNDGEYSRKYDSVQD